MKSALLHMRSGHTWWLIPLSKWAITPVINGISRVNPLITGVITHLLSGMSHQVCLSYHAWTYDKYGEREGQKTKSTCILKSIHRNVESYVAFRSDPAKFTTGRTAVLLRLDHASIEPPSHANASGWVEFSVISYDDFVLAQNRLVEDRFAYWIHH